MRFYFAVLRSYEENDGRDDKMPVEGHRMPFKSIKGIYGIRHRFVRFVHCRAF